MSKYKFETSKKKENFPSAILNPRKKNLNKNKKTLGQTELPGGNPEQQIVSRIVKLHDL